MPQLPVIRHVLQKHWTGCAIACIAMMTGLTYDEAAHKVIGRRKYNELKKLDYHSQKRNFSLEYLTIVSALRSSGLKVRLTHEFSFGRFPAVLMCDNYDGSYHCVVWDPGFGGRIVDPAYTSPEDLVSYKESWKSSRSAAIVITGIKE